MRRAIFAGLALAVSCLTLSGAAPQGWIIAGTTPTQYNVGMGSLTYAGDASVSLASASGSPSGFVTLMQTFLPKGLVGRRVQFSGYVKSELTSGWAGLWMRMDAGSLIGVEFDNMQTRPIEGSTDWTQYSVVLDVPAGTTAVNFGILLDGVGTVWLSGVTFQTVTTDVPVTAMQSYPTAPQNLSFQQ